MVEQSGSLETSDWLIKSDALSPDADMDHDPVIPNVRNLLSSEEIEALLRPDLPDTFPEEIQPDSIRPKPVDAFDDMTPTPDRDYAARLAARLSLSLSKGAGFKAALHLDKVTHLSTTHIAGELQECCQAIACFGTSDQDVDAMVCLPAQMADAIIAQACGARVSTGRLGDGWTLSAIDCALLHQLLLELGSAFEPGMHLQAIETNIPYVTSLIPEGEIELATYAVEAPGLQTQLHIVRPRHMGLEATRPAPAQELLLAGGSGTGATAIPVTALVTARMARLSVPLSHVSNLKAGSTLLLGLPVDQPVEVLSGDRHGSLVFEGKLGRNGNQVAVKITRRIPNH